MAASTFAHYARYYDLLYRDKPYQAEADYIKDLVLRFAPNAKTLAEFGCGTGNHAALLAERGFSVRGIDQSRDMLKAANARKRALPKNIAKLLSFSQGDFRSVKFDTSFDAAISLFHVVSYLTKNEDLQAAFANVKAALKPGGIFVFDVWYGPAVLTDRPATRIKRLADEVIEVTRLAEPAIYPNENLVDVNYHVFVTEKATGNVEQVHETHRMRYLFRPELESMLAQAGLTLEHTEEWLTRKTPGFDTWGVCFVARA